MSAVMTRGLALAAVAALAATPVLAQDRDTTELARLKAQVEAITRELEELRLGREVTAEADTTGATGLGLAPAASKVYRVRQGVSIGGYGEFLYTNFAAEREDGAPSGQKDQFDALRAIVYVGYKFNDRILFNSELEFEHGSTSGGVGEVSIEFAYLDYRFSPYLGARAGLLLAPMGIHNELHEPPIFLGTTRPLVETNIIPTTWRENGVGLFGSVSDLNYRVYAMNGLNAAGFGAGGLRGGRQKGARALAENFGLVGRVDYTGVLGLSVGASAYYGNSGQGLVDTTAIADDTVSARTAIVEAHATYNAYGFDLRALYALADVDDAAALNRARGLTGAASVGERLEGWYVQAGYDVLRPLRTSHQLIPYVRYEQLNTQARVPAGFTASPANDRSVVALGAMWKPIPQVSLKADWQIQRNEAETGVDQLNVNVGYLF